MTVREQWALRWGAAMSVVLSVVLALVACGGVQETPQPEPAPSVTHPAPAATATAVPGAEQAQATPVAPTTGAAPAETVAESPFQPPDLFYLGTAIDEALADFDGLASYYVADLRSGQSLARRGDVAISGMSMVKIPILLETYRALETAPTPAEQRLITETATLSGNFTANLLLELIAGRPDPFAGAQVVTESMRRLGLPNTFIAVPYDEEPRQDYLPTYLTPANQRTDVSTNPDSSMQTTTRDMGELLGMIYACSEGEGVLLDLYGESLTPGQCRAVMEVMKENDIDAFIEAGVPAGIAVAHKHGWVAETHGDAGLVFAGEHPYVLVVALHREGWLEWAESTAIIRELSGLAYAHFSDPLAYSPQFLQTPPPSRPTPTPTPDLPTATVAGTGSAGLTLRAAPGGAEVAILPEGTVLFLLEAAPVQAQGSAWRQVRAVDGSEGWVVLDFLQER